MGGESSKQTRRSNQERRAAAQAMRQQQLAQERRRRTLVAGGGVVAIVVVIGILVAVGLHDKHGGAIKATETVSKAVTSVPVSVFDAIGAGGGAVTGPPTALKSDPLTENGKPKVLFVGAEWCPYCAAQRWVMAVALSRFGTFTNLGEVYSAANDGDLASLSFHGSTYTSKYLTFDANEVQDRDHKPLDTLSAANQKIFDTYGNGYPFIDLGGTYEVGSMYNPEVISGLTQQQIAAALSDPSSPVAQAINGSANVLTATLCKLTGGQPATVCQSPGVRAAA